MSAGVDGLPGGWATSTLGELAEVKGGLMKGKARNAAIVVREVPYLRVANVQRGYLDLREVSTIAATDEEIAAMSLIAGDVLFNEGGDRDKLGRGWVWEAQIPVCIHQNHVFRGRFAVGIQPKFVSYYANEVGQSHFLGGGKQTTNLASISMATLRALPVVVPPSAEQTRIVAKIDALQTRSSSVKEALDAIPPLLEKFRQSVLAAAFRGDLTREWREAHPDVEPAEKLLERIRAERKRRWVDANPKKAYVEPEPVDTAGLPELPGGWCWARFDELLTYVTSGSRGWGDYYSESGPVFIRAQDIKTDFLDVDGVAHVCLPSTAEGTRTLVQAGDLLVTITGANVTKAAVAPGGLGEAYVSQHVALCRPVLLATSGLLHLWLVSEANGRGQLLKAAYGGGKPGLGLENIRDVMVALPPLAEQTALESKVQRIIKVADEQSMAVTTRRDLLATLTQSILSKAFRGELVPQDPNDEPASALLDRIRRERESNSDQAPAKRGRKPASRS